MAMYSNLPMAVAATKSLNGIGFPFTSEIILGSKIEMSFPCLRNCVVRPGMNEDLRFIYTRQGRLCIETHFEDWRDPQDPNWNKTEQLFFLLFGSRIWVRSQDFTKIKRHASILEDDGRYVVLELLKDNDTVIFRIDYMSPQESQYLFVANNEVEKVWASNDVVIQEVAKKMQLPTSEFTSESGWVQL